MKTVLITGASTGIGYYCAKQLHQRDDYQVIASCRKTEDVKRLNDEGLICIQLDLDDSDSIQDAVKTTLSTYGNLYALFNNGAYGQAGAVEDLSRDTLRQQFESNLFGWLELTNTLLPYMHNQGYGRIIQNSSVLGFAAMPFRGAYNASKFALEGLTDTLRQELSTTPIHVSLIEPGPIKSDFRKNAMASLLNNIDINGSRHNKAYLAAQKRLSKVGPASRFTLGPEAVYEKLLHALESPKPKARYYVTFPTYLMGYLKRILSTRAMDWLLIKAGKD